MANVSVREAHEPDLAALRSLVVAWISERGQKPDGDLVGSMILECIRESDHTMLVAQVGDTLAGYAAVHWISMPMLPGREGYVSDLVVAADWRGRGIGSNLLRAVEQEAVDRACIRLTLNNRTDRESYERGFYPREGFRERTDFANFVKPV